MPAAARSLDLYVCAMHLIPDVPASGAITPRIGATVNIGFLPAARQGDEVRCVLGGAAGHIVSGEPTVNIEGKPAARITDRTGHLSDPVTGLGIPAGTIETGCPTVNIGMLPQVEALEAAARDGAPLCEECEK